MAQDQLRKAFALMKQGDKKQAAQLVQDVIKQDRNSVPAWWMMANVLDDPSKKQKALEKVLSLDPNHTGAQQMLATVTGSSTPKQQAPRSLRRAEPDNADAESTTEKEFDWGKLEAREAKKKSAPKGSEDQAIKMASYVMIGLVLVVVVVAIIFVFIPSFRNGQTANAVEDNMTDFLSAMMAGDFETAESFVCAQYRRDQGRANFFALDLRPIYARYQIDLAPLKINVSDFTATSAVAKLSGNVRIIPTEGEAQILSVDDIMGNEGFNYETTSFTFSLENNQWLICDTSFTNE